MHEAVVGVGLHFWIGEGEEERNWQDDGGSGGARRGEGRLRESQRRVGLLAEFGSEHLHASKHGCRRSGRLRGSVGNRKSEADDTINTVKVCGGE